MDSFDPKTFIRTLSYKDFASSITLVLLLLAIFSGLEYYQYGWIAENLRGLKIAIVILVLPVNHIVYRLEHGRQNNLAGRSIHDCIYILLLLAAMKIKGLIIYGFAFQPFTIGELVLFSMGIASSVIFIEFFIALFKHWLSLAGWQIL